MNMNIHPLIHKLRIANEKIQRLNYSGLESEKKFYTLLNYDFIEPILAYGKSAQHFKSTYLYFDELIDSGELQKLHDDLSERISSLGTTLLKNKALKKRVFDKEDKKTVINPYTSRTEKAFLPLRDIVSLAFNRDSYWFLPDLSVHYIDDFSFRFSLKAYLKQFEIGLHLIVQLLWMMEEIEGKEACKKHWSALRVCQELEEKLERMIDADPKRVHYAAYESLGHDYVMTVPKNTLIEDKGHYTGIGTLALGDERLKRLKKDVQTVLNDMEFILMKDDVHEEYATVNDHSDEDITFYKDIGTNFKAGEIFIRGGEKRKLQRDRQMYKFWRLLTSEPGNIFSYQEIAGGLELNELMEKNRVECIEKIKQTKKNLVTKIASLGKDQKEVSEWFSHNNGYGLK